jgi:hypothetical protein
LLLIHGVEVHSHPEIRSAAFVVYASIVLPFVGFTISNFYNRKEFILKIHVYANFGTDKVSSQ